MNRLAATGIQFSLIALLCVASWVAPTTAYAAFTQKGGVILPGVALNSISASLADIDNDGDLDLFFQGFGSTQRLYRNNIVGQGVMTFTNVTATMIPSGLSDSWSAAWGDYNGDGLIDVFVGQTNSGSASGDLLTNTGTAFVNSSIATGLNDPGWHQNLAWTDIDRDRDLDLLIGMEGPEKHEVYLHGAGNQFTKVGAAVGFQQDRGTKGYGMAIGDTDSDGDLDVYISTCEVDGMIRNNFYKNMLAETGSLSFVDIADSNGTQFEPNSYGVEFLDLDDDSDLDLFMTGADGFRSKIFRNDGGNEFTDVDTVTGRPLLTDSSGDLNGSRAVDYDNDGDLDLFFHNHLGGGTNNARKLYRNDGDWLFTDVTAAVGIAETNLGSYDSPWGDIDLDGDLDLIATTDTRAGERVYLNDASTNGNHWLMVRLEGPSDNTTGIGASLYATINAGTPEERTLRREANTNAGTFNQSDLPVHFGLGAADHIDELAVHWPDGTIQVLSDVAVNRYLTIRTPGDFNGDGQVTADDLLQWEGDFGVNALSDADLDGDVDGQDFLAWQRQLGNGVPGAASAASTPTPEPSAMLLLTVAVAVVACQRRGSHL